MELKDYYKILGVDLSADAKAIKAAYRKLAREYHPDMSEQHNAKNRFKEITEACEVERTNAPSATRCERMAERARSFAPPQGGEGGHNFGGGFTQF